MQDPELRGLVVAHGLGSGKCVRGDTPVLTDRGLLLIRDMFQAQELPVEGEAVLSPTGHKVLSLANGHWQWTPLRARFCQHIKEHTYKIRAAGGVYLEGTGAHPLLVVRRGVLSWVPVRDLVAGDFLAVPQRTLMGDAAEPPEELVDLVTWQVAEGWENPSEATTSITQNDVTVLEHLQRCFRRLYPGSTSAHIRHPRGRSSHLDISCREYRGCLEAGGYIWGHKSAGKALPPWFLLLPDALLRRGLRNMFDAEGSVDNYIEFPSASLKLVQQVQYALLRFGVRSSLKSKIGMATNGRRVKRIYYRLFIMGEDAATFLEEVGFSCAYKQDALRRLAAIRRNPNCGVPIRWVYDALRPFGLANKHLKLTRNRERSISYASGARVVEQLRWLGSADAQGYYVKQSAALGGTAREFCERTLRGIRNGRGVLLSAASRLQALLDAPLRYREISSVSAGEFGGLVYDLEVDADDYTAKNYVGGIGGIVLHNTLSAIAVADALGLPADVVTPASLKANFEKELAKHTKKPPKVLIQSLENVARGGGRLTHPLLIVDEVHRTRNPTKARQALLASPAQKRLLLTGSPFYNAPSDIAAPVNLAAGENVLPASDRDFVARYVRTRTERPGFFGRLVGRPSRQISELNPKTVGELTKTLRRYVDYYPGSTENFPEQRAETIEVPLSSQQREIYDSLIHKAPPWVRKRVRSGLPPRKSEASQLNAFLSGVRQVSNTSAPFMTQGAPQSPKIDRAVQELQKVLDQNERAKAVVFSNYLEAGVQPYKARLDALGIPYGEFTGAMPSGQRAQLVKDYNAGQKRVLLLSSAGGEGLDLQGTRLIQILEPHWNEEKLRQVIGRGIRYKSHESLPPEERNVLVQRFLATLPRRGVAEKLHLRSPGLGADEYLHRLAQGKEELNTKFRKLLEEKQAAEYAPGIREKGRIDPIPVVDAAAKRPAQWLLGLQRHQARKLHADLRIIGPEDKGHSWAIPQARLPSPGQGAYGFRVETHSKEYSLKGPKGGRIPAGSYGAGTVKQLMAEPIEVTEANDKHLRFNVYSGRAPQEFFMKRMGEKRWLIRNVTPTEGIQRWQGVIPHDRPPSKERPLDGINPANEGTLLQPKIDGAHGIVVLEGGRPVRVFSYRKTQGETGLIEHTHKFPEYGKQIVPAGLGQTILRAEISGVDKQGKPLPAERIGGLLNAGVWKSRAMQEATDQRLTLHAFKPVRVDGKRVKDAPYLEQLRMLEDLHEKVPMVRVMPTARTPAAKMKLIQSVREGTHPLTDEGVMEIDAQTGALTKGKIKGDFDVYVREVVPGKREGDAGAFRFSWTPRGEVVGRVGTGLSDDLRQKMLAHPEQYLGRVAKVTAQKKYPSGALRAPVFDQFHIEKGRI